MAQLLQTWGNIPGAEPLVDSLADPEKFQEKWWKLQGWLERDRSIVGEYWRTFNASGGDQLVYAFEDGGFDAVLQKLHEGVGQDIMRDFSQKMMMQMMMRQMGGAGGGFMGSDASGSAGNPMMMLMQQMMQR